MKPKRTAACAARLCMGVFALACLSFVPVAAEGANEQLEISGLAGKANLSFYRGDHWGVAQTTIGNPSESDGEARLLLSFQQQPRRQFVRRVWLPAMSRRLAMLPVRYAKASEGERSVDTEVILTPPNAERQLDRAVGLASIRFDRQTFAAIVGSSDASTEASEVMSAIRDGNGLSSAMSYIDAKQAPRFIVGWDGVDAVAIMSQNAEFDAAQGRSLRRWLRAGGKLVVFATQAPAETMARLLGEEWGVSVVSRISLTSIPFEPAGDGAGGASDRDNAPFPATVEVEQPIQMTRLIAPGYETHLQVRGWPALLSRSVGAGEVIVATVGGRAWTHPAAAPALRAMAEQVLGGAGSSMAQRTAGPAEIIAGEAGERFVSAQVGYHVVSRPIVGAVLGGFLLVLVIAAALWWRGGRLERIGPVGAIAAVAAMAVLLAMGRHERQQVPPTRASVQLVSTEPGRRTAEVAGVMGLYDTAGRQAALSGRGDATAWPVFQGESSGLMRLVIGDLDTWRWEDLPLPGGAVQPVDFTATAALSDPLRMNLRYGPNGLAGTIDWPVEGGVGDALLATARANMRVDITRSGERVRYVIRPGAVLPPGAIYTSGLVSEAQRERASVIREILAGAAVSEPTLLAWSLGLPLSFELDPPLQPNDHALWTVPLKVEPTEPGTAVHLPWPLVPMRPDRQVGQELGLRMLPIYRPGIGWTQEVPNASAFVGRFTLPEQVRPLDIERATVHLDITAIGRPVRLLAIRDGQTEVLETFQSPDGMQTVTVPGEMLQTDEAGGVLLAFDVGALSDQSGGIQTSNLWQVRRFGLSVQGTVREESN